VGGTRQPELSKELEDERIGGNVTASLAPFRKRAQMGGDDVGGEAGKKSIIRRLLMEERGGGIQTLMTTWRWGRANDDSKSR